MYINRGLPGALRAKFDKVFEKNLFHGETSKSGKGSSLEQTFEISRALPRLIRELEVKNILDVPCGDLQWMSNVNLSEVNYIGGDVAPSLISHLQSKFKSKEFRVIDITTDTLPKVDLIFCRDLFVHLSNRDINRAISNIKLSGSRYLATTSFSDRLKNEDLPIITRGIAWRPLNLEKAPFNFPVPVISIDEKCTEGDGQFADKKLVIWEIKNLP
jgi:hypothetical protein